MTNKSRYEITLKAGLALLESGLNCPVKLIPSGIGPGRVVCIDHKEKKTKNILQDTRSFCDEENVPKPLYVKRQERDSIVPLATVTCSIPSCFIYSPTLIRLALNPLRNDFVERILSMAVLHQIFDNNALRYPYLKDLQSLKNLLEDIYCNPDLTCQNKMTCCFVNMACESDTTGKYNKPGPVLFPSMFYDLGHCTKRDALLSFLENVNLQRHILKESDIDNSAQQFQPFSRLHYCLLCALMARNRLISDYVHMKQPISHDLDETIVSMPLGHYIRLEDMPLVVMDRCKIPVPTDDNATIMFLEDLYNVRLMTSSCFVNKDGNVIFDDEVFPVSNK